MSHFRPLRASPPLRPAAGPSSRVSDFTDDSHPPIAPELIGLSVEEIDFIDEVIGRAPATASTFLTVFKAYNDVLQERGLDPQNEVVYYGKLLKIGTLKGKNWADKWNMVKEQQGYVPNASNGARGGRTTRVSRTTPTPSRPTVQAPVKVPYAPREPDTFTLHSHQHDGETTEEDPIAKPTSREQYGTNEHDTPRPIRRFGSPATVGSSNSLGLDTGPPSGSANPSDILRRLAARARTAAVGRWDAETTAETTTQASSIPPSYGAVIRDDHARIPYKDKGKGREMPVSARRFGVPREPSPPIPAPVLPKQSSTLHQRERRGSVGDPDDAFRRVREAQDEEIAAQFYNDRLVERCYEVWKQGYEWVIVRFLISTKTSFIILMYISIDYGRTDICGARLPHTPPCALVLEDSYGAASRTLYPHSLPIRPPPPETLLLPLEAERQRTQAPPQAVGMARGYAFTHAGRTRAGRIAAQEGYVVEVAAALSLAHRRAAVRSQGTCEILREVESEAPQAGRTRGCG